MPTMLTVRDENPAGGTIHELALEFLTETITVRALIRGRVYQEVQDYNLERQAAGPYRGLVQPEGAERALNPARARAIDWHKQYDRAIAAFERDEVLVLIDDRQAGSLDESFTIRPETRVTFLKLTLLVGG